MRWAPHMLIEWDLEGEYPPQKPWWVGMKPYGGPFFSLERTRNLTGADCASDTVKLILGVCLKELWPEAMNSWPVRLVDPLGPLGPRGCLRRCLVAPGIQAIQTTSKAVSERNNMVVVHIKSPKNTLKHLKTIPSTLKNQNQLTNSLKPTPKPSVVDYCLSPFEDSLRAVFIVVGLLAMIIIASCGDARMIMMIVPF